MDDAHDPTSCRPMSLEHYHAAGFRGPLPTEPAKQLNWSTVIAIVSLVLTALLLFLLLLGTAEAYSTRSRGHVKTIVFVQVF